MDRSQEIIRTSWIGIAANVLLAGFKAGIEMLASPVNELLGTSISADFSKQIQKEVSDFEGVHGVFDLILHNYGPDVKIGSLHINVYDTMSAYDIHGLTRRISTAMWWIKRYLLWRDSSSPTHQPSNHAYISKGRPLTPPAACPL